MSFIKLKEVNKRYHKHKVLEKVNLKIDEGDIFGIIGESGSGKTTLLNLIAGFVEPSSGEVVYMSKINNQEKNLHKNLHKVKKHIGFTSQHNSFYHKLTVKENLLHFGKMYKINRKTLIDNIKALLHITQLYEHKEKIADHLSGGMQKRLDIACSLVHKPKILVLDEPTADLDPILQKETLRLLQEVNKQGVTVIIASHHLDSIERICNKIAVVKEGKVHSYGSLEEIRKPFLQDHFLINIHSPKNKELLIDSIKKLPINKIIDKDDMLVVYPKDVETTISKLVSLIKDENIYLPEMNIQHPSLHKIFEKITKSDLELQNLREDKGINSDTTLQPIQGEIYVGNEKWKIN